MDDDVEVLFERLWPRLVGALVLQTGDRAQAEDLAQEALARAWERWDQVAAMASPEAWVFRVAWNLAASDGRRRQRWRRRAPSLVDVAPPAEEPADRMALRAALATLPERQRAAVVLRYYVRLPVADAAEAMGCADGTVRSLCHQGLAGLRTRLGDDDLVRPDDRAEEDLDARPR